MLEGRRGAITCRSPAGRHRLSYVAWGGPDPGRTVVCMHGLTGNARDFEELAGALAREGHHVVCPDLVGRGQSDWLADPDRYVLRQYADDARVLNAELGATGVDWVGTSLGGLVGLAVAAGPETPVRRLVVNDIGPFVPTSALQRLAADLGTDPTFADLAAAERWLRRVREPLGPLSDAEWRRMAERTVLHREGGGLRLHYDPRIADAYARTATRDLDLWAVWDAVTCPVLVLRGERSDLLLGDTAREMTMRGPPTEVVEVPQCGHAPALLDVEQISLVTGWLRAMPPTRSTAR